MNQTSQSKKSNKAAIALGSNLGVPKENLQAAIQLLTSGGFELIAVSEIWLTKPVDCVPGTPDFHNMAITGFWDSSSMDLLDLCQAIERNLGRPAEHRQDEARLIDLDILLFGEEVNDSPRLTLPHPRMHNRLFVLGPLNEIAPNWQIPGLTTVSEQLAKIY